LTANCELGTGSSRQSCDERSSHRCSQPIPDSCSKCAVQRVLQRVGEWAGHCVFTRVRGRMATSFRTCSRRCLRRRSSRCSARSSPRWSSRRSRRSPFRGLFATHVESCWGDTGGAFSEMVNSELRIQKLGRFTEVGRICTILHIEGSGMSGNSDRPCPPPRQESPIVSLELSCSVSGRSAAAGIASYILPSSSRPFTCFRVPPHCLK